MSEVSCRAMSFFEEAEKAGVCSIDALIKGLPVSRAFLAEASNRVSWDVWAEMSNRFGDLFQTDEDIINSADFAINSTYSGYLSRMADLLVSEAALYRVAIRWAAPSLYRSVAFSMTETAPDSYVIEAELMDGYKPSRAWFLMMVGGILRIPQFMGHPQTPGLIHHVDDRSLKVQVTPQDRKVGRRRRWQALFRSPDEIERELIGQQEQITLVLNDMRQTSESFKNVLIGMPAAVLVLQNDHVVFANPAGESLFVHAGHFGGKVWDIFHEEDRPLLTRVLQGMEDEAQNIRTRSDHGKEKIFSLRVQQGVHFQGQRSDLLIGLDVTAEHHSKQKLERSEATLLAILKAQPELIIHLDRHLRLLDVKPGVDFAESQMLISAVGASMEELLKRLPHLDTPVVRAMNQDYQSTMEAGQVFERRLSIPGPDGQIRYLSLRGTPLMGGQESVLVARDETNQTEVDQRLRIAERMASVGTLAAGVAHEINNPLTYMMIHIELLAEQFRDHRDTDVESGVESLRDGAERIRQIVDRMRQISRIDHQRRVPVSVTEAIRSAVAITDHQRKHIADLSLEIDEEAFVLGDPTELGQVFINLISNALDALRTREDAQRNISIRVRNSGSTVTCEIEDNGSGISPAHLTHIFDPFFTTRAPGQGTGIGLSIVRGILVDLGGDITVSSEPGKTIFSIVLPRIEALEDVDSDPQEIVLNLRSKVVVIDDEPLIRKAVERILDMHDVLTFADAPSGLEYLLREDPPELILCDLMMPGFSGMELFELLAKQGSELISKIVFTTGGTFTLESEVFVQREDVRVLYKPLLADDLRRLVARFSRVNTKE